MDLFKCKCCEVLKSENAYLRSKLDLLLGVADTRPEDESIVPGAFPPVQEIAKAEKTARRRSIVEAEDPDKIVFGEG